MIAWVFIALSAIAVAMSALQTVMVWLIVPAEMFRLPLSNSGQLPQLGAQFMLSNSRYIVLGILAIGLTALAGSIALLKRINWGRLLIIGFLGMGILWNFIGFGLQLYIFTTFPAVPGEPHMRQFFILVVVFGAAFILAFSALFAWLIKKFLSAEITKEFVIRA